MRKKRNITKEAIQNRRKNFYHLFGAVETTKEAEMLLSDLCTPKEIDSMKERFVIASLLQEEFTYHQIAIACKTSTATITRVARFLNASKKGGYQIILNRIKETISTK